VISFSVCVFKDEQSVFLLRPGIREYFADPFILGVHGDTAYVLVEVYRRRRRKGDICLLTVDFQRQAYRLESLIEETYHLSYPCVIRMGSDEYVMPESEAASAQYLYRLEWERQSLRASKTAALPGRYVDLTVRPQDDGRYVAQFFNGTSNSNGVLFEADLMFDGTEVIRLGEEVRVRGRRRPGGRIEGGPQPFQRPGVDYGSGLDLVDASGQLVAPEALGLPALVSALQHRMHHLSQSHGCMTFDVKEKVAPRLVRQGFFGSAAQVKARIESD